MPTSSTFFLLQVASYVATAETVPLSEKSSRAIRRKNIVKLLTDGIDLFLTHDLKKEAANSSMS